MSILKNLLSQSSSRPIVLDGGLGTTLRDDFKRDCSGAVWSSRLLAEDPAVVSQAHAAFLEAGAEIILTCTYQTSVDGFVSFLGRTAAEAEDTMRLAVKLAVDARDAYVATDAFKTSGRATPAVGLSLGPYGAMLLDGEEFTGKYPADQRSLSFLTDFHTSRLRVFAPLLSTLDFIAFETVPLAVELSAIRCAITQVREADALPFTLGVTCPSGIWGDAGGLGVAGREAIWSGEDRLPTGVAINCTDASNLAELIPSLTLPSSISLASPPTLILYPNHNVRFLDSAAYWDNFPAGERLSAPQWVAALLKTATDAVASGAWAKRAIVGGCCGTGIAEITELRKGVDAMP